MSVCISISISIPISVSIYLSIKKLVHAIMEAEKSHDLLSLSWRPRRAGDAVPVQIPGAGDQERWSKFQSKCSRKPKSRFRNRQKEWILPHLPFVQFRPPVDWISPAHIGKGNLLHSIHWFKSHPETPSQTHPESCLAKYWGTLWPSQVDTLKLTITGCLSIYCCFLLTPIPLSPTKPKEPLIIFPLQGPLWGVARI